MEFGILISALGKNLGKISKWLTTQIVMEVSEVIIVVQESKGFVLDIESLRNVGANVG